MKNFAQRQRGTPAPPSSQIDTAALLKAKDAENAALKAGGVRSARTSLESAAAASTARGCCRTCWFWARALSAGATQTVHARWCSLVRAYVHAQLLTILLDLFRDWEMLVS